MNNNFSEKVNANSHALKILRSNGRAHPAGAAPHCRGHRLSTDFSRDSRTFWAPFALSLTIVKSPLIVNNRKHTFTAQTHFINVFTLKKRSGVGTAYFKLSSSLIYVYPG